MARRLLVLVVVFAVASGSCSSDDRDTADGFCRRFNDLRRDLVAGELGEADFKARITAEELGDPGTELSRLRDELEAAALAHDADATATAGEELSQLCAG